MKLNGKVVALVQLLAELQAAGLAVAALTQQGDDLLTYTGQGTTADLPANAQSVVDAHVPQPLPQEVDDANFRDQYQAAITRLTAIVDGGAAYTAAQVRDAVVDMARIERGELRAMIHRVPPAP